MDVPVHRRIDPSIASAVQEYRPFIDGLRAISIVAVVAYHVAAGFVPGGFVGVDIFFVISGFLIIGQIVDELRRDRFSFAGFWGRRALRILPPYLLVIVSCLAAAPLILVLPGEYHDLGEEAAYSAGMMVNHLFLAQQGYFDHAADTKVLLHLWSLSVEEQFYLVAPVLIYGGWRLLQLAHFTPRAIAATVTVIASMSLIGCIATSDPTKNYAFYLMPLRAWEFVAGGAIIGVLPYVKRLPPRVVDLLAASGMAAIAGSILLYSDATPFPSFYATVPVLGACMLITAGLARPESLPVRFLALAPMVWIGLVSYAWYLWHWPLLAFARIHNFGVANPRADLLMAAASLVLATLTYLGLELPVRAWRKRSRLNPSWRPTVIGVLACVPVVLLGVVTATWVTSSVARSFPATMLPGKQITARNCQIGKRIDPRRCLAQLQGRRPGVILGDSHAFSMYPALDAFASDHDRGFVTLVHGACPPMFGLVGDELSDSQQAECFSEKEHGRQILAADQLKVRYAIIAARWPQYTSSSDRPSRGRWLLQRAEASEPEVDQHGLFVSSIRETIAGLRKSGIERILVIAPVPEYDLKAPECVARSDSYGLKRDDLCSADRADAERDRTKSVQWLEEAVSEIDGTRFIDPLDVFCDQTTCRPFDGDTLFYRDDHHLSDAGVNRVIAAHRSDFLWLLEGQAAE